MPNPLQPQAMSAAPPPDIAPVGNALQQGPPGAAPAGAPGAPPAPPQLSHNETVAALRHFDEVGGMFGSVLKNEGLGKQDVKSSLIDAVTKLVADRVVPPTAAVELLSQFPTRPFEQKQWIEKHYQDNQNAAVTVLDHHRAMNAGAPEDTIEQSYDPEQHMGTIGGVLSRLKGAPRA